ncbi:MAG: alpha/beta fold hydrolase, partial [Candidatus Melainabacteria bacterium]|nr:alpha/beta fold hydrolase [Candidatus Melainabacteria bacterium]
IDPTVEQKAILLCVHGLSLNARAFAELANKLAPRGFMVIAFNMRGFGTNLFSKGSDKFEPKACLDDLYLVMKILHRDSPNVPVFLLGESVGGAMVLNLAARHPELVKGVICSVPSGKRFGSFSESMLVAGQYFNSSKRPFDIGQRIIEQATTDPKVREKWSNDPINRRKLSPSELVAFQEFMDESERLARQIKTLPVIMFQGLSDQLVRPEGSANVYLSLDTKDKDFIVLGRSEHLIFEMGQTPSWVIEALCSWLEAHL